MKAPPAPGAADIALLVERFYGRVRADPELGPVFAVVEDWEAHLATVTAFWSSVALGTRSYRGDPMAVHRRLPIGAPQFTRWLRLWRETAHEVLDPAAAGRLSGHAERIARSLWRGIVAGRGAPPRHVGDTPGEEPRVASDR